jgi:uncharacterized protein (TIGR02391 family)
MKVKEAIIELWKIGFFADYKHVSHINKQMLAIHGTTCSNTTMILKQCKDFLRKDKKGWIQKTRFSLNESDSTKKKVQKYHFEDIIENKQLWNACQTSFENGEYWDACLHAFRHLETKIREKSKLPAEEHGVDLINKAFNQNNGLLRIPCCATRSEEEGFQLINRGIVLFHRNAKGHREGSVSKKDAIKIIGYVDYMLELLKTAELRSTA